MAKTGEIDPTFAAAVLSAPLTFLAQAPALPAPAFVHRKAVNATRIALMVLISDGRLDSDFAIKRRSVPSDSTLRISSIRKPATCFLSPPA